MGTDCEVNRDAITLLFQIFIKNMNDHTQGMLKSRSNLLICFNIALRQVLTL